MHPPRTFYKFLCCFGLCVVFMCVIFTFIIIFFELNLEALPNQTLPEWPIILEKLPYLAGVVAKINGQLPSSGLCTLQVLDSGGTMREKYFTCQINNHIVYEMTSVILIYFYIVGFIIMLINILTLFLKCVCPKLRR